MYQLCSQSALLSALTAFLNCYSVKMATRIQNICTFTKLGALAVIAIGGIVNLSTGTHAPDCFSIGAPALSGSQF